MAPDQELFIASKSKSAIERLYAMQEMKVRLHQSAFRARVIGTYETRCAICQLRHRRLLDAAQLTPDNDAESSISITNESALFKIHHLASDGNTVEIISVYVVKISEDVLQEEDGPVLRHGLVEMHNRKLWLPTRIDERPDRNRLATRDK